MTTTSATATYITHDNGARPFKVTIDGTRVCVYRRKAHVPLASTERSYEAQPCLEKDSSAIFVGKSPVCSMTEFSGGIGPGFDGNSILIRFDSPGESQLPPQYCFIGNSIKTFRTLGSEIVSYVSPVGNNDVPYPYAVDAAGHTYLMIENVVLSGSIRWRETDEDPYSTYYARMRITDFEGFEPPVKAHIPGFRDIITMRLGDEQFSMNYRPFPEAEYDRYVESFGPMTVAGPNGKFRPYTKQEYCAAVREFGDQVGFVPLAMTVLVPRDFSHK